MTELEDIAIQQAACGASVAAEQGILGGGFRIPDEQN